MSLVNKEIRINLKGEKILLFFIKIRFYQVSLLKVILESVQVKISFLLYRKKAFELMSQFVEKFYLYIMTLL